VLAGIICDVLAADCVNLVVFGRNGTTGFRRSVPLVGADRHGAPGERPTTHYAQLTSIQP
jgi:hypothetical protein